MNILGSGSSSLCDKLSNCGCLANVRVCVRVAGVGVGVRMDTRYRGFAWNLDTDTMEDPHPSYTAKMPFAGS